MFVNIIQTIFFLIVSPKNGWRRIIDKKIEQQEFINNFLFPIFGFIAITTFIGGMWLTENGGIHWALKQAIVVVSALFGGFYLALYALNELFPRFGLAKNLNTAQQFVGYSSVVLYLLFLIMPLLSSELTFLWIFVIYTLYIVYVGTEEYLSVVKNKRLSFTVIVLLLIVLVPLIIKFLLESVINLLPN